MSARVVKKSITGAGRKQVELTMRNILDTKPFIGLGCHIQNVYHENKQERVCMKTRNKSRDRSEQLGEEH